MSHRRSLVTDIVSGAHRHTIASFFFCINGCCNHFAKVEYLTYINITLWNFIIIISSIKYITSLITHWKHVPSNHFGFGQFNLTLSVRCCTIWLWSHRHVVCFREAPGKPALMNWVTKTRITLNKELINGNAENIDLEINDKSDIYSP